MGDKRRVRPGAMVDSDMAGRELAADRVRAMLHRALFTRS